MPKATVPAQAGDCDRLSTSRAKGRMRWAQLLKRLIDIGIEHCTHCGEQLKLIAAIEESAVIQRILTHLGLAAQPIAFASAARLDFLRLLEE